MLPRDRLHQRQKAHSENNQKILELDKEITRDIDNNRFKPSPSARSRFFSPFKWIGHQIRKCFRAIKAAILGYFGLGDNYYTTRPLSQTVTFYLPRGEQNIYVEETIQSMLGITPTIEASRIAAPQSPSATPDEAKEKKRSPQEAERPNPEPPSPAPIEEDDVNEFKEFHECKTIPDSYPASRMH